MRKTVALLVTLLLIQGACLAESASQPAPTPTATVFQCPDKAVSWTDDNGLMNTQVLGEHRVIPTEFPYSIQYNDSSLTVNSIDLYQDRVNHGYALFVIIDFDVSTLSDDQIYWLDKSDIRLGLNLDQVQNNLDFYGLRRLGAVHWTDTQTLDYIFYTSNDYKEYRYPFDGSSCNVFIDLTQNALASYIYDGEQKTVNRTEGAFYELSPETIPSLSTIPKYLANQISDMLDSSAMLYVGLQQALE